MLAFIRVAKVMVTLYSAITLRKTGVGPREQGIAVAGLTMLFLIGIWKSLGFGDKKVVECFKTIVLRSMWTV